MSHSLLGVPGVEPIFQRLTAALVWRLPCLFQLAYLQEEGLVSVYAREQETKVMWQLTVAILGDWD